MKREGVDEKNSCNFAEKLLNQDKFGQPFRMRLDKGRDALPSRMGALCSILSIAVLLTYVGYKINILQGKKSIDIIQAVIEDHFDETDKFTASQGLNIAAGVGNPFIPSTQKQLDPSFGRIRFT